MISTNYFKLSGISFMTRLAQKTSFWPKKYICFASITQTNATTRNNIYRMRYLMLSPTHCTSPASDGDLQYYIDLPRRQRRHRSSIHRAISKHSCSYGRPGVGHDCAEQRHQRKSKAWVKLTTALSTLHWPVRMSSDTNKDHSTINQSDANSALPSAGL